MAPGVLRCAFVQILNLNLCLTALRRPSFGLRLVLGINVCRHYNYILIRIFI